MKIIKETISGYNYALDCPFSFELRDFCRHLKEKFGWKMFCFMDKKWRFNDPELALMIQQRYPEIEIPSELLLDINQLRLDQIKETQRVQRATELKASKVSDLIIKGMKKELYPFQKIGVEFLLNSNGVAILADEMGVGKSCQALGFIVYKKVKKTLVVCPSSVKFSWQGEIKKFTKLKSFVIDSRTNFGLKEFNDNDIIIINYDILKKFYDVIMALSFDCCILDEFQYIKSRSAIRSKLSMVIASKMKYKILLSGTPLMNRPVELFNGLNLIDPKTWYNYRKYTIRYCDGHEGYWGWDCRGASNIAELQQLISKYFLRRLKKEVLPELPPKQYIDLPFVLDNETMFEYKLVMTKFVEYLRDVKQKTDMEIRRSLQAEKLTKLSELRQIISKGKLTMAKEVIDNVIDGDEKIVVFSCYHEPLLKLKDHYGDSAVLLTGDMPDIFRQQVINDFQNDPKIKIFLGGIKSAGVGITLTAASNVLFIDYDWVPANHWQAEDRIHRVGQTASSISIYQLVAKDTIDEYMSRILEDKQALFNTLIEGGRVGKKTINVVDDLLKMIENN